MIQAKPANPQAPNTSTPLNFIEQKDADQLPSNMILLGYAVTRVS